MPRHPSPSGGPLGDLLGSANVLLTCNKCMRRETHTIEGVIANLLARGVNGPAIGICVLNAHVTRPCPTCDAWSWNTSPDYGPYKPPGD